jgi:hypothetical protein
MITSTNQLIRIDLKNTELKWSKSGHACSAEVSHGGYTLLVRCGIFQMFATWALVQDEFTITRCAHEPTRPYNQLNMV